MQTTCTPSGERVVLWDIDGNASASGEGKGLEGRGVVGVGFAEFHRALPCAGLFRFFHFHRALPCAGLFRPFGAWFWVIIAPSPLSGGTIVCFIFVFVRMFHRGVFCAGLFRFFHRALHGIGFAEDRFKTCPYIGFGWFWVVVIYFSEKDNCLFTGSLPLLPSTNFL
jgi:hypothetical protein